MTRRALRIWTWLAMIGSGATLFQTYPITGTGGGGNFGCQRFATNAVSGSLDFCYVFDCQNGFFGGVVDPCNDTSMGPWLLDCPDGIGAADEEEDETDTGTEETDLDELADWF